MVSVLLYPCIFCIALSIDLFAMCVACAAVLVYGIPNNVCVECDPSVHLDVPSTGFLFI